jgi:hypothetical protein
MRNDTLAILTDADAIAINQEYAGNAGDLLRRHGETVYICVETTICLAGAEGEVWYKPLPPHENSTVAAVALLNPQAKNGTTVSMQLKFEELPILQGARRCSVLDVWAKNSSIVDIQWTAYGVEPMSVRLLKIQCPWDPIGPTPPPPPTPPQPPPPSPTPSPSNETCRLAHVFESENIMGGDINSHTCNSTVACAAACCNEPRCNAFTLDLRKARCWLKDGHRTPVQKDGCTSGNVTAHPTPSPPPHPKPPSPPPAPPSPPTPPTPSPAGRLQFWHPLFSDGMILQSDRSTAIWGLGAKANSTVTLSVSDTSNHSLLGRETIQANETGGWRILIQISPHNSTTLVATDSSGASASLEDVAWGAVLLCGGQSNSE